MANSIGIKLPDGTIYDNAIVDASKVVDGLTADDVEYSSGVSVKDKLDDLSGMYSSGVALIASPRISITNQNGTYYRIGNFITAKITLTFGSDGQQLGTYFTDLSLDNVVTGSTKVMGFMGVDNDLYEIETLNNDSMWAYKNGSRFNSSLLNGKVAYITIQATI